MVTYPASKFFRNDNDPAGREKTGWNLSYLKGGSVYFKDKIFIDLLASYKGTGIEQFSISKESQKNGATIHSPWDPATMRTLSYPDLASGCRQATEINFEGWAILCEGHVAYGYPLDDDEHKQMLYIKELPVQGCNSIISSPMKETLYIVCSSGTDEDPGDIHVLTLDFSTLDDLDKKEIKQYKFSQTEEKNIGAGPYKLSAQRTHVDKLKLMIFNKTMRKKEDFKGWAVRINPQDKSIKNLYVNRDSLKQLEGWKTYDVIHGHSHNHFIIFKHASEEDKTHVLASLSCDIPDQGDQLECRRPVIIDKEIKKCPNHYPIKITIKNYKDAIYKLQYVYASRSFLRVALCMDEEICSVTTDMKNVARDMSEVEGIRVFNDFIFVFGSTENPEDEDNAVKRVSEDEEDKEYYLELVQVFTDNTDILNEALSSSYTYLKGIKTKRKPEDWQFTLISHQSIPHSAILHFFEDENYTVNSVNIPTLELDFSNLNHKQKVKYDLSAWVYP